MHFVDQERLLDESLTSVKQAALQMESCLDKGNIIDAIRSASDMIRELRTSFLSPKSYYELYIAVTEKLQLLESSLIEEHKNGRRVLNLYEIVQYNQSIIPRLYLLITVGVYLIKCDLSRREIMRDLVEMCCGVQHPVRGLFLRNYLLHALRTELVPIVEEPVPPAGDMPPNPSLPPTADPNPLLTAEQSSLWDSVNFLLFNFAEMNKLWVRMQHQGHSRDRERREQERRELRLLVGTNLNRLAQLDAIDVVRYGTKILPSILEQLIECHDVIAQEYLMDVIIQVFPDEFHLATLPILLETCNRLQPGVKPKGIICGLIGRLSQFALNQLTADGSVSFHFVPIPEPSSISSDQCTRESNVDQISLSVSSPAALFAAFFNGITNIIVHRIPSTEGTVDDTVSQQSTHTSELMAASGVSSEDIPSMYAALVHLVAVLCLDDPESHVDACLNATADLLGRLGIKHVPPTSPLARELLVLLHVPIGGVSQLATSNSSHKSARASPTAVTGGIKTIINMHGFRRLVSILDPKTTKCRLACNLLARALEQEQQQQLQMAAASANREDLETTRGLENDFRLTSEADVDSLFELMSVLFTPESINPDDPDEFAEVQSLIAGTLHLLGPRPRTENPGLCFKLLVKAHRWLSEAGSVVIRFNFPALIFECLELVQAYADLDDGSRRWDREIEDVVTFVYQCASKLLLSGSPDLALRLMLKSALIIDQVDFSKREPMAYEFVSQALTIFEECATEARTQIDAIGLITGTLCHLRHSFGDENRKILRKQCSRAATHLLRKHDQSRAVAAAAHLYWPTKIASRENVKHAVMICLTDKADNPMPNPIDPIEVTEEELNELRDGKSALWCLDRASKLANDCIDTTVKAQLLLNVLNHGICLKMAGCPEMNEECINKFVESVQTSIDDLRPSAAREEIKRYFSDTLAFLNGSKDDNGPSTRESTDQVADLFSSVSMH